MEEVIINLLKDGDTVIITVSIDGVRTQTEIEGIHAVMLFNSTKASAETLKYLFKETEE